MSAARAGSRLASAALGALGALVAVSTFFAVSDLHAQNSQKELLRAGDAHVEEGRYADALDSWRRAYLQRLPDLRGREFEHPVEASFLSRAELSQVLVSMLEKEWPPSEARADALALWAFGFTDSELDLRALYTELLLEQIAGFYNPETKRLYLIAEPAPEKPKKPSIWDLFLGGGETFDSAEQKAVLSHEMSHALADQQFDIYSMQRSIEDDADMSLAYSALVEGEAMLVMMLDQIVEAGRRDPDALEGLSQSLANPLVRGLQSAAMSLGGGGALGRAPRVIRESLIFPYEAGMTFCAELASEGSWSRIDGAFRTPPSSTEQVLHPEKLGIDQPMEIRFTGESPLASARWEHVDSDCLGEFGVRVLFSDVLGGARAERAAAGWDGDRYIVFAESDVAKERDKKVAPCLVWATTWDEAADAEEFALAYAQNAGFLPTESKLPASDTIEGELADGRRAAIRRAGRDVFVVDHAPKEELSALLDWAKRAEKSEKKLRWRRFASEVEFGPRRRRV